MITTVTPCYKSELYLPQVVGQIKQALKDEVYQIILVCDGSPDNTFEEIRKLCDGDPNIVGINLTRNFGQPSARCAAIPYIKGDYVVFIDDDGEHPAVAIKTLVNKLKEGYDIVYADMQESKHSLFKQFGSFLNRTMMNILLGVPKNVRPTSFFATKKFVAKSLLNYNSPSPYSIGYFLQVTRNVCNVPVVHQRRIEGKTTYSFSKLFQIWLSGFTSFSIIPLRFASICGIGVSFAGVLYGLFTIIRKLIFPSIAAGFSSIMATILFSTGLIMFMLGLLGEYIGRIFLCINHVPQYVVRESINDENI